MPPSYRSLLLFFLPLVVISFSQAFTYPLVGSIISHGPLLEHEFEAYVIGQQVVSFLSSIGFGLITTGMVFATTRRGLGNFMRLNLWIAIFAAALQVLASLPAAEDLVFRRLLGVPDPGMRRVARHSILACIPVQINFYVRNIYLAILFRAKRSDLANVATLVRVALAAPFSVLFVRHGLVGYLWGAFAMTAPCLVETALTWWFARPYAAALPERPEKDRPASVPRQLRFTLPLSLGSALLMATAFLATFFLSRTSDPGVYRPVHFVAYGLALPFFASALRFQTVTVAFAREGESAVPRIVSFALLASVALSALPVALSFAGPFARWYFCAFQNLPPTSLRLAAIATAAGGLGTVIFALRGIAEGVAATRLRPGAVLAGQMAYLVSFALAFLLCEHLLPVPGYLWGMVAIAFAGAAATLTTHAASRRRAAV